MALRKLSTGIGFTIVNAATCASAWTPESVRPDASNLNRRTFDLRQHAFENTLDRRQPRLHLPAVILRPVVADGHADAAHYAALRDPGFSTGVPSWHMGQKSGG